MTKIKVWRCGLEYGFERWVFQMRWIFMELARSIAMFDDRMQCHAETSRD